MIHGSASAPESDIKHNPFPRTLNSMIGESLYFIKSGVYPLEDGERKHHKFCGHANYNLNIASEAEEFVHDLISVPCCNHDKALPMDYNFTCQDYFTLTQWIINDTFLQDCISCFKARYGEYEPYISGSFISLRIPSERIEHACKLVLRGRKLCLRQIP
jgi:hypothetical protein